MKPEAGKLYRTRNMGMAKVEHRTEAETAYPWHGWVIEDSDGVKRPWSWDDTGRHHRSLDPSADLVAPWNDGWVTLQQWIDCGHDAEKFKAAWIACRHDPEKAQIARLGTGEWLPWLPAESEPTFCCSAAVYRLSVGAGGLLPEPGPEPKEPTHTTEPWTNGYGNGVYGPTTPTPGSVTVEEIAQMRRFDATGKQDDYPWGYHTVITVGPRVIAIIPTLPDMREEGLANAQRIVDCVNACAGIEDPAQMREVYTQAMDEQEN